MTFRLQSYWRKIYAKHKTVYQHLFWWTFFIIYEVGTKAFAEHKFGKPLFYVIFYLFNIALFYINAFYVLPLAWRRPKRPLLISILIMMLECVIYLAVKALVDYLLEYIFRLSHDELTDPKLYFMKNLWRFVSFLAISSVYWSKLRNDKYYRDMVVDKRKKMVLDAINARLEKSNAEMENAFLQQQIHPHFLFNALNFIYSSFYKLSDTAAECVGKLTDIFRYSIYGSGPDQKAYLRDEVEQIKNFIAINRLRFGYPIYIDFEIQGDITEQRIIPLVLLSYVENVFKYGTIKEKLWPVQIVILITDTNHLTFTCYNLKNNRPPDPNKNKDIGLENTAKRLSYSYPNKHQLSVKDEEDTFGIELQIYL